MSADVVDPVEVLMRTFRAKRPGGAEVSIAEYWTMVDTSPRFDGSNMVPAGKRYALTTGEPLRKVDEGVFQLTATGEVLISGAS